MVTIMAGAAVAPALGKIAEFFPEESLTTIKLILTLPAVFMVIFSLVSGRLTARFSKRKVLCLGLLIYLASGIGGGFANSIEMLLLSRALLGIGVGLIMPLSTGLITDFFEGEERVKTMGYSTASSNLGGIITTLASGALAVYSWRFSFGVYSLGFVALFLVLAYLPEQDNQNRGKTDAQKLPITVYAWAGAMFLFMLTFYSIPVNVAIFLKENQLGDASSAGLVISLSTAGGFVGGITFAHAQRITKNLFPVLLVGFMSTGYLILSHANSLPLLLLSTAIIGLGLGWTMPVLFVGATKAGGEGMGVQTMAVVSSLAYLGQFLSPIILDAVGQILGNTSTRFIFLVIGICYGILVLFMLLSLFRMRWRSSAVPVKTN